MAIAEIPVLKRQEKVKETGIPQFQSAFEQLGESSNISSLIGTTVTQAASNQMAAQLGYQSGQHPQGDLLPPITDFDKHFSESYHQQADATLTIAAEKLFTDTQIQLAKSPRMTPELIRNANEQLRLGLSRISETAPTAIKGKLDASFASSLLSLNKQTTEKMFAQNREDEKNTLTDGYQVDTKNSLEFGLQGNRQGALDAEKSAHSKAQTLLNNRHIDKEQARKYKEEATQSRLTGEFSHQAEQNYRAGTYPVFEKLYMEKKLHGMENMTNDQFLATGIGFTRQINFLEGLKSDNENYRSQLMLNRILTDAGGITNTEWTDFTNNVSPLKAEQVKFHYLQALLKGQTDKKGISTLKAGWPNATVFANADAKLINQTFNELVDDAMEFSNKTIIPLRSPTPLTRDQAEVQVAANSGGKIPVFTETLQNKLKSSNPVQVESGMQQIHALLQSKNGQVLTGLNDQDWSMYTAAESLRDSPDPIKGNQDAHNRIYNQTSDAEKLNNQKFQNVLTKQNAAGVPNDKYALTKFGFEANDFLNPSVASAYALLMLNKYKNFYSISGDFHEAEKSTQRWIDQNIGNTWIDGFKHKTLNPVEARIGFSGNEGTPYIQQNIVDQLDEKLIPIKARYHEKKEGKYISNEYWETIPVEIPKGPSISETLKKRFFEPGGEITADELKQRFAKPPGEVEVADVSKKMMGSVTGFKLHPEPEQRKYEPATQEPSREHGLFFKTHDPIKIKRYTRTATGEKVDTFNMMFIGNAFGDYDVAIQTKEGSRNLFQEAPYLGIISIQPQDKKIRANYNKDHNLQ